MPESLGFSSGQFPGEGVSPTVREEALLKPPSTESPRLGIRLALSKWDWSRHESSVLVLQVKRGEVGVLSELLRDDKSETV